MRWSYDKIARALTWRVENILKMRAGGASEADVAAIRADVAATYERSGWTDVEFMAHLGKRLDKRYRKELGNV